MTREDLPWVYDLCCRRYGPEFHPDTTAAWFLNVVLPRPLEYFAIRSERALTIVQLTIQPFRGCITEAQTMFTCAEEGAIWDVVHLLRKSKDWSKERGASRWCLWSETSFELGPLARRLGFPKETKVYVLDL